VGWLLSVVRGVALWGEVILLTTFRHQGSAKTGWKVQLLLPTNGPSLLFRVSLNVYAHDGSGTIPRALNQYDLPKRSLSTILEGLPLLIRDELRSVMLVCVIYQARETISLHRKRQQKLPRDGPPTLVPRASRVQLHLIVKRATRNGESVHLNDSTSIKLSDRNRYISS
jgi:hypothetical protein